jgi:hypothetical protein
VLEDLLSKRIPYNELIKKITSAVMLLDSWDRKTVEQAIIGHSISEAELILRDYLPKGLSLRVTKLDGRFLVVTSDFVPTRINVDVMEGKIVNTTGIG